jgi:hypothetical protein
MYVAKAATNGWSSHALKVILLAYGIIVMSMHAAIIAAYNYSEDWLILGLVNAILTILFVVGM